MNTTTKILAGMVLGMVVLIASKRIHNVRYEKVYDEFHIGKPQKSYFKFL